MHIDHIAIWTKDLERLRNFYERFFGAVSSGKYSNPRKQFETYFLSFPQGARLEIMCSPNIPASTNDPKTQFTGLIHMAFSVGSHQQVDSLTEQLRQAGFPVLDGPRATGDGYYESAILDPDGNRVEITK